VEQNSLSILHFQKSSAELEAIYPTKQFKSIHRIWVQKRSKNFISVQVTRCKYSNLYCFIFRTTYLMLTLIILKFIWDWFYMQNQNCINENSSRVGDRFGDSKQIIFNRWTIELPKVQHKIDFLLNGSTVQGFIYYPNLLINDKTITWVHPINSGWASYGSGHGATTTT
jgi:hypothetical protein